MHASLDRVVTLILENGVEQPGQTPSSRIVRSDTGMASERSEEYFGLVGFEPFVAPGSSALET